MMTVSPNPLADDSTPYTVQEFCDRNRISITSYYKLRKRGQGPRELRVLSKVQISPEAERDWQSARENPDQTDKAMIERMHIRGREAGRRSKRGAVS
jgi:hypothetical protein